MRAWAWIAMGWASAAWATEPLTDDDVQVLPVVQRLPEAVENPAPPRTRDVHLVYSGALGGLGSGRYLFEAQDLMLAQVEDAERHVVDVDVLHGVMVQEEHYLWSEDGRVESILAFVRAGQPECTRQGTVQAQVTPTELLFAPPGGFSLETIDKLPVEERAWWQCTAGGVSAALMGPPQQDEGNELGALAWDVGAFEMRLGYRWVLDGWEDTLLQFGRPRQEAGRRVGTIRSLRESHPGTLYVDAGNFLDGASAVQSGSESLHRAHGLEVLEALRPTVLVPGRNELSVGVDAFIEDLHEHDLPYVATNWRSASPERALPQFVRHAAQTPEGDVDLLFLGVIDPDLFDAVPGMTEAGITLEDPVEAVEAVVDELARLDDLPDAVVLVTLPTLEMQGRLRAQLHGVDVLMGDPTAATYRVARQETMLRPVFRSFKAAPMTLPLDGVAQATLSVGAEGLSQVRAEPVIVTANTAADREVTRVVTEVRAEVFPGLDDVLVDAPPDAPVAGVSQETWERLICESLLESTGADVAFLAQMPQLREAPGALTELIAADLLATFDVVELHKVDGNRMGDFLRSARGAAPIHCGANVGPGYLYARGRLLDAARTYRVATTDRTRRETALAPLLEAGSSDLVGHQPRFRTLGSKEAPLTLHEVVMRRLRRWRDTRPDEDWVAEVVARSERTKNPQWLLRFNRIGLQIERFQGPGTEAYAEVPETLINSPSSFTLGGDVDVALDYSSRQVLVDFRVRGDYTRLVVDNAEEQETADDWRVSSSLSLPMAAFPSQSAKFRMMPYGEILYDSEFTPGVDADGATLSRQSDLSFTAGIGAARSAWLRSLRLGAFVSRDMARLTDKSTEYGGRLEAETWHHFLPKGALRLTTLWDLQVFGDTPEDDAADLRLRLAAETRLSARIVRWMNLSLFVRGLMVQGRVPETQAVAGSMTVGFALDLSTVLQLGR